jgi:kynurenine formamidase
VTIENMNNLHLLKGRKFGDLIVGAPTKLKNGSGYQTNVLAFLT